MSDAFITTYSAVSAAIAETLLALGREVPLMERPELAAHGLLALPVATLVAVPADGDFVDAVYVKLLDRAPQEAERAEHLAELAGGQTRRAVIDAVLTGEAYARRAVPVELIES